MENNIYNTGETTSSLKRLYNAEGSKLRKFQIRMLDMLLYIDEVCKSINVSYRIDGGTVLGAVRHKGFIPWDDDIDIVLERSDWKKLCKYLISHPHSQYVLQTHQTDKGFYQSWAKIRDLKSKYNQTDDVYYRNKYRGAQIDIFCYDKHGFVALQKISKSFEWLNVHYLIKNHPVLANIVFLISNRIVCPFFRFITTIFSKGDYYMHSYGAPWTLQFPTHLLLPHKLIEFEGHKIQGPADPGGLCEFIYGKNYNKLPPVEKRVTHAFDVEIWE